MRSLLICAGSDVAPARRALEEGTTLLAWDEPAAVALAGAGLAARRLADIVTPAERLRVDEAAIAWTKDWGRRPLIDGQSFRDLARWREVPLWYFAELYLHHSTGVARRVRLIETLHRIFDAVGPEEVDIHGLAGEEAVLVGRVATARRALWSGPRRIPAEDPAVALRGARWNLLKTRLSAIKAALRGSPPSPAEGRGTVLFFSHAAFWRTREDGDTGRETEYEHYFDRLLPALAADPSLQPFVVAVGPRAAFRKRGRVARVRDWLALPHGGEAWVPIQRYTRSEVVAATAEATSDAIALWQRLRDSPALEPAFEHRGVRFADMSRADMAKTLLLQLPWAVRCIAEAAAVLRAVKPVAACLYAESSGWGRAALRACADAAVPTVAIQHGILYPEYYSYRHDADEDDCPRPDRTAVFGEQARRFLENSGRYRPDSLVVTGSPKFDDLVAAARDRDRAALRERLGVSGEEKLIVIASRHRSIRDTHESIGSAFPGLLRAIETISQNHPLRGLVKPHPAEPAAPYEADVASVAATRVRILGPAEDLVLLLHAADLLVTVESLSAVEALVLGCPVVVLNMPTKLRSLVEAGAALGVTAGDDPADTLRRALFDETTREVLERARTSYLSDVAHGADGGATARILALLRQAAGAEPAPVDDHDFSA